MRNLRMMPEFTPMEVVTPESMTRITPHPFECWDWWEQRGFKVHYMGGILGGVQDETKFNIALPRITGKGIHEYHHIEWYGWVPGWEDLLTHLIYERELDYHFAWRLITRLHGVKETAD